jgi:adenine-specific DNA methylase
MLHQLTLFHKEDLKILHQIVFLVWLRPLKHDQVIKANLKNLNIDTQAEVYKNNADRALKALAKREIQFDVIFLDPPYENIKVF